MLLFSCLFSSFLLFDLFDWSSIINMFVVCCVGPLFCPAFSSGSARLILNNMFVVWILYCVQFVLKWTCSQFLWFFIFCLVDLLFPFFWKPWEHLISLQLCKATLGQQIIQMVSLTFTLSNHQLSISNQTSSSELSTETISPTCCFFNHLEP